MAWNTDETKRKLREAAFTEFARCGPDGTTMAHIAEQAGINKERLYKYFGDKRSLFTEVLTEELAKLSAAVPLDQAGIEDIGAFAGRTFDYHAANPQLVRLLLWEGLAAEPVVNEVNRSAHYQEKVRLIATAQKNGLLKRDIDPAKLVFLLIGMAAWWFAVPQLARMLTGADADEPRERARRRTCVVIAAKQLALSHSPEKRSPARAKP